MRGDLEEAGDLSLDALPTDGSARRQWSMLAETARHLHSQPRDLQATLDAIVTRAVEVVPAAAHAGLIEVVRGRLEPLATCGTPPHTLDLVQRELDTGPCLDAARHQVTISVPDTSTDPRWPAVTQRGAALGVCSMLCVPLRVDRTIGTLSLYGASVDAFDADDLQLTEIFAAFAAAAFVEARRSEQLDEALASRDLIGQAKGILMERLRLTADAAFACLSAVSQQTNVRLATVAQQLAETGELPTLPDRPLAAAD